MVFKIIARNQQEDHKILSPQEIKDGTIITKKIQHA
jgi:hypothetical protein